MTINEFLIELEKCKSGFFLEKGLIRHGYNAACPICKVCHKKTNQFYYNSEYLEAASTLNLNSIDAINIVKAADDCILTNESRELRNNLLKVLEL